MVGSRETTEESSGGGGGDSGRAGGERLTMCSELRGIISSWPLHNQHWQSPAFATSSVPAPTMERRSLRS